jgi:hypothetical protein
VHVHPDFLITDWDLAKFVTLLVRLVLAQPRIVLLVKIIWNWKLIFVLVRLVNTMTGILFVFHVGQAVRNVKT